MLPLGMRSLLVPLSALLSLACGTGSDGARPAMGAAGEMPMGSAGGGLGGAGGAGINSAGSPNPSAGSAGLPAAGGTAGSAAVGGGGSGPVVPVDPPSQRVVVYLPDYRGPLSAWTARIDPSRMTYLNLCFAAVDAAGNVSYSDAGLDAFVASAHAAGVKVCMAIGGASVIEDGGVYATILQDGTRSSFVDKLTQYAVDHQLDCIDVDLEGNGVNQYYEAFVVELAAKLHGSGKEMTSAVGSWFGSKITDKAIQAFDFINVMAYDLHNPGGSNEPVQSSSLEESKAEVDYWVNRGLAKEKAVFGVPFYGYTWKGGNGVALTYSEILAAAPDAATQDQVQVAGATTYLNSRTTIQAKAVLAKQYGGIMIWELGQDAAGDASLLKAIIDATP
jgi:chitinase